MRPCPSLQTSTHLDPPPKTSIHPLTWAQYPQAPSYSIARISKPTEKSQVLNPKSSKTTREEVKPCSTAVNDGNKYHVAPNSYCWKPQGYLPPKKRPCLCIALGCLPLACSALALFNLSLFRPAYMGAVISTLHCLVNCQPCSTDYRPPYGDEKKGVGVQCTVYRIGTKIGT